MLIVYQSLESTGTKDDESSTFMAGNSFKHRVHDALPEETSFTKTREWHDNKIIYATAEREQQFATSGQSRALSKQIKNLDDLDRDEKAIEILSKIVASIVDNASQCTSQQGALAPFVRHPDIIVLGEVYATDLCGKVLSKYVVVGGIDPTRDARHRFMVLVRTGVDGKTADLNCKEAMEVLPYDDSPNAENKNEHSKCMLIKVRGWLIAFVHTPNKICQKANLAAQYLHNNAQRCGEGSELDLVMGDTNQPSRHFVKRYMNNDYNRISGAARTTGNETDDDDSEEKMSNDPIAPAHWDDSIMERDKQVIRGNTNYPVLGTNSNYTEHFDIACTPRAHVQLSGLISFREQEDKLAHELRGEDPDFLFHGLTDKFIEIDQLLYAYSDHNGVIVEILRDKPVKKRKVIEDDRESSSEHEDGERVKRPKPNSGSGS